MSFYGRFEQIVTWILTLCIAVIIAIALFRLVATIFQLLVFGALNPLNHEEFEVIFGMIMTLLIAMEFNHSILQAMERLHRVIQVKTVILISILALARKFIILNMEATRVDYCRFGFRGNRTRLRLLAVAREGRSMRGRSESQTECNRIRPVLLVQRAFNFQPGERKGTPHLGQHSAQPTNARRGLPRWSG